MFFKLTSIRSYVWHILQILNKPINHNVKFNFIYRIRSINGILEMVKNSKTIMQVIIVDCLYRWEKKNQANNIQF